MAERVLATAATTHGSSKWSLLVSATQDELIVARILLDLRYLMDLVESAPGPKWRRKRRRSCLSEAAPSLTRTNAEMKTQVKEAEKEDASSAAAAAAAATVTASPVTPFAFPPSESDEKPRSASKKSSKKRSRQEYHDLIAELTRGGDLLRKEFEDKTEHYNQLNAENSQLKAIRQKVKQKKLNSCPIEESPEKERIVGMNLGAQSMTHLQPRIADRTVGNDQPTTGPITCQMEAADGLNKVAPNTIPDLNLTADMVYLGEESQPLNEVADRRARCAEARRIRKGMMKIKAMRSACLAGSR